MFFLNNASSAEPCRGTPSHGAQPLPHTAASPRGPGPLPAAEGNRAPGPAAIPSPPHLRAAPAGAPRPPPAATGSSRRRPRAGARPRPPSQPPPAAPPSPRPRKQPPHPAPPRRRGGRRGAEGDEEAEGDEGDEGLKGAGHCRTSARLQLSRRTAAAKSLCETLGRKRRKHFFIAIIFIFNYSSIYRDD